MFFNLNNIFNTMFFHKTSVHPPDVSFDKIELTGGVVVDDIHIINKELTDAEISDLDIEIEPTWISGTLLLALFNNNLQAGNVTTLNSEGVRWILNRRVIGESSFKTIFTSDLDVVEYIDYRIQNGLSYEYELFLETVSELSEPFDSPIIRTDFFTWSLADETTNEVLNLNYNRTGSDIVNHVDITDYDGYTKFSKRSQGDRNYDSGTLTALALLNDTNLTHQDASMIEKIKDFINNRNVKILKSPKGEIWRVVTDTANRSPLHEYIDGQPQYITINWREVGEI